MDNVPYQCFQECLSLACVRYHHYPHGCIVSWHMWPFGHQTLERGTCWPTPGCLFGKHRDMGGTAGWIMTVCSGNKPQSTRHCGGTPFIPESKHRHWWVRHQGPACSVIYVEERTMQQIVVLLLSSSNHLPSSCPQQTHALVLQSHLEPDINLGGTQSQPLAFASHGTEGAASSLALVHSAIYVQHATSDIWLGTVSGLRMTPTTGGRCTSPGHSDPGQGHEDPGQ